MDNTDAVRQQFGKVAESYVNSPVHAKGSDLAKLLEVIEPQGAERVLDVATGTGHTALALAPRVASVVGLDVTPEMLGQARRLARDRGLANVDFVEGSVEHIPFPAASFDLVTCRIAAHHFADPDRAFAELARVLVPGGRLIVVDNYAPDPDYLDEFINTLDKERDPSHVRAYKLSEWQALFERHGLTVHAADLWYTPHNFEAWTDQAGTLETIKVELRRLLVEAAPEAREAFHISTAPELTFSHPKAMMVGRKANA